MLFLNALPQRLDSGATPTFAGILAGDGTAAAPSISFAADTDTGFYRSSSGNVRFSSNGVDALQMSNTGTTFIPGGINAGYISNVGANGGLALFALGNNQNITLTPSGTGVVAVTGSTNLQVQGGALLTDIINPYNGAGLGIGLGVTSANPLRLGTATPNSANGILQLATHTSSAGGVGFGTDTSLYRSQAQTLAIQGSSQPGLFFYRGSTLSCFIDATATQVRFGSQEAAQSTLIFSGNATALTLDSSQNATFAGTVKPQLATTAGAPAYVKGAIYFDTTLNKLRVGGASAWETITSV